MPGVYWTTHLPDELLQHYSGDPTFPPSSSPKKHSHSVTDCPMLPYRRRCRIPQGTPRRRATTACSGGTHHCWTPWGSPVGCTRWATLSGCAVWWPVCSKVGPAITRQGVGGATCLHTKLPKVSALPPCCLLSVSFRSLLCAGERVTVAAMGTSITWGAGGVGTLGVDTSWPAYLAQLEVSRSGGQPAVSPL